MGVELARLGQKGRIPAPRLTESRRQFEAAERKALAHYRAGHIALSQGIRSQHGWEHDLGSPHATREALADAAAVDIATHGPSREREVLDALLRVPDTGFATHDNPARISALIAERNEHRAVLAGAPSNRRRELDRAERELRSAKDETVFPRVLG